MNRRQIFNSLSVFTLGVLALPKIGFSKIKSRVNVSSSMETDSNSTGGEFVTVREFQSLLHPQKNYRSISEFWDDHQDNVSDVLKKSYLKKGYLTSSSELLSDGRTIRQTKRFKSERLFRKYQKSMKAYYSTTGKTFKERLKRIS
jgi:hypothetical protein